MNKKEKIILGISVVLLIGMILFEMFHKTVRTEQFFHPCKIIEVAEDGTYLVELPAGDNIWIEVENEVISEDGKYVTLEVYTHYNGLDKIVYQTVINTGIIKK